MDVYYECLENDDYFLDQDLPEEPWESRVRRQSQDGYGVCDKCGKSRGNGNCSCVLNLMAADFYKEETMVFTNEDSRLSKHTYEYVKI